MLWLPNTENVVDIHKQLTELFAKTPDPMSPPGVRDIGYISSACARPYVSLGNVEKYTTPFQKFSALFHSLTKNHAFHNGNKRTALVTLLTCLDRNDYALRMDVTDDKLYNLVVDVTKDAFPDQQRKYDPDEVVFAVAAWIRTNSERVGRIDIGPMKTTDFIAKCRLAGASAREGAGGSWIISNANRSVRISMSTPSMNGSAVQAYLKRLRINPSHSGVNLQEFVAGVSISREQIRRYMRVLRRLSKT